jgi:hypothetical protein
MSINPEQSTAINQEFEIIKTERRAKQIAKLAIARDMELRQAWLSRNFQATFGQNRDSGTYFGYEGPTLLDAINEDGGAPYLRLWAGETMSRALTHLSMTDYEPVSHDGFAKDSFMEDRGHHGGPSTKERSSQLTYVDSSTGPDWLRPKKVGSTLNDNEQDYYGIINQLPDLLRNDEIRKLIKAKSTRRNLQRGWPVDSSANGLGGVVVELNDLVFQITHLDPTEPRFFKAPGVAKEGDKYPPLEIMQDPHLIRAWRTEDVA